MINIKNEALSSNITIVKLPKKEIEKEGNQNKKTEKIFERVLVQENREESFSNSNHTSTSNLNIIL